MKNKELIFGVFLMMALFFGWLSLMNYLNKAHPEWGLIPASQPSASSQPIGTGSTTTAPSSTTGISTGNPTTNSAVSSSSGQTATHAPTAFSPIEDLALAQPTTLGSASPKDTQYTMQLAIDPRGAGLSGVTLNDFQQKGDSKDRYVFQTPVVGYEDATRPLASRSVSIDGINVGLSDKNWTKVSSDVSNASYLLPLGNTLLLTKTFQLIPRNDEKQGNGFDVVVRYGFKNVSGNPVTIKGAFNGVGVPPREAQGTSDRQIIAGFDNTQSLLVEHHLLAEFSKDKPTRELLKSSKSLNMLWAGGASNYFNAILRVYPRDGTKGYLADCLASVRAELVNPDAPIENHELAMVVETTDLKLEPNESTELTMRVFLGPRQRSLLGTDYYSAFPRGYDESLVLTSGPCAICTFSWLINILVGLMGWFHWVTRDWGLAIIFLVILVRTILHPISKKSQVNMARMGKMAPEIERLKKKHGDNKDELNKAMMEVYKEQGFTPVLGCLPMFLQMPIFIALWQCLQTTFELRHEPFLYGLTWIHDLSQPDQLIKFGTTYQFFIFHVSALNILPLAVAVVQFYQMKLTPRPPAQTPEQEQQQKMMQYMTFIFPLIFYSFPSGLNIYYLTSTGLGIIESKIIRKHLKEQEMREKSGVIIDAPRRSATGKSGGLMGWVAKMQMKAEEMQNQKGKKR